MVSQFSQGIIQTGMRGQTITAQPFGYYQVQVPQKLYISPTVISDKDVKRNMEKLNKNLQECGIKPIENKNISTITQYSQVLKDSSNSESTLNNIIEIHPGENSIRLPTTLKSMIESSHQYQMELDLPNPSLTTTTNNHQSNNLIGIQECNLQKETKMSPQMELKNHVGKTKNINELKELRSDVLYKTIMRDMRKFYTRKFNEDSQYIRKKRNKGTKYFVCCLESFLVHSFPELAALQESLKLSGAESDLNLNEMIQFLGCLLYPKDMMTTNKMKLGLSRYNGENSINMEDGSQSCFQWKKKFQTIHSYLYQFSLERLSSLIDLFQFAFLFCNYFQEAIVPTNRFQNKSQHQINQVAYVQTCNQLLDLCQKTLHNSLKFLSKEKESQLINEKLMTFINIQPKKYVYLNDIPQNQYDNIPGKIILPRKLKKCLHIQQAESNGSKKSSLSKKNSLASQESEV
ncbi:UNKNOWN [Stylonychia lemnae]|uniref:Uncharacterized protein n=1 Tax=Stylonychia lemnae TaxID=5949 RepID=A0A078AR14_STYLE|nr:UNKNOWN [Stylonychia lemnae]|eukprot:CDW84664.1 UNKNOWN [Stylonychia lemnae]